MPKGLVLFDLDGTLIDTAPDLCAAANFLRKEAGLNPLDYALLRPLAGTGAKGLIRATLGVLPEDARYPALKEAFLAHYASHMTDQTLPFPGILSMLSELNNRSYCWGIVTNKAMRLAAPLVEKLFATTSSPVCFVAGDTTKKMKPDPEPLLAAVRQTNLPLSRTLYIGDEERDIKAAKAAGIAAIAALWGYGTQAETWHVDALATSAEDIPDIAARLLSEERRDTQLP